MKDLSNADDEAAFRAEIARFLKDELPDHIYQATEEGQLLSRDDYVDWQRKLVSRGWGAVHWPEEWGGTGWSLRKHFVFDEEMGLRGAPNVIGFNTKMIGPILLAHGTEAQKQRFLPRALNFDDWWCQGYSEPSSGSDLASLRTRARLDGDHYVVSGSKIWTSHAHHANWMFCLVRTDTEAKPQQGISFLLIDMTSPGIKVDPIRHFYGAHVFNQIHFDDVRVPLENRVGAENAGWTIAKDLLEHERLGSARHVEARRKLMRLIRLARKVSDGNEAMIDDPVLQARIAALTVEVRALEFAVMRGLEGLIETGTVGTFASVLKLRGISVNQALDEAVFDLFGPDALPGWEAHGTPGTSMYPLARYSAEARYYFRGPAIAGGSAEVQREVIAKRRLGM